MNIDNLFLRLGILNSFCYTATKCKHRTKRCGSISVLGHTIIMKIPKNESGAVNYCLNCIGKMTIQCAWCGDPIFIGEPITLYTPCDDDFQIPECAVIYNKKPLQLVGCLGWNCAETGADRAGFWIPGENGKGRVLRVPTACEVIMNAKEPSCLIINDAHDITEATNLSPIPRKKQS